MKKNLVLMLLAASVFTVAKAEEQTVECGKTVKIEAKANEGYRFIKWSDDTPENPQKDNPRIFENVQETIDLKAIFAKVFKITLAADEGGKITKPNGEDLESLSFELLDGESIEVMASVTDDCYEFKGWSDGEENPTRTISTSALANPEVTITAVFALKTFQFTVSAEDDTMGTVSFSFVTADDNNDED